MEYTWNDRPGPRMRRAWLLLVVGDHVLPFTGKDIPGVAVVCGTDFEKFGKWSNTTYRLEIADGVRPVAGRDGWGTGRFVEGLATAISNGPVDTWVDVAQALGVSVTSAMEFLEAWRPDAAKALHEVSQKLVALDEAADEAEAQADNETVVVSFGSPTRRARADGFWTNPKEIPEHAGELRLIDPDKGWVEGNVTITGITGAVLSVVHRSGYGGGHVTVTVSVIPGTETSPQPEAPAVSEQGDKNSPFAKLAALR